MIPDDGGLCLLQVYVRRYVTTTQLALLYPPSSDAIVIKEVDCFD